MTESCWCGHQHTPPDDYTVVYENRRWWQRTMQGNGISVSILIIPRGHTNGAVREECAARGCYLCRVVLDEAAERAANA
ncbi:hypothetical protein [Mycolicibacterium sphagni]|uniref:hypothetical protein n=1 Tax=Mycolicibacterium sphagni TaxID=1786 RepID=UPI0021F299F1|nr:hypothetical protein [Mycolicibacterium sphagni]MCV7175104.1 hypothetical protein [Mycolicibacterium sphagni]